MPLHDFAADRQAYPCPLVFVAPVQVLEHLEDAVQVDFLEADAVVLNSDFAQRLRRPVAVVPRHTALEHSAPNRDDGRRVGAVKL